MSAPDWWRELKHAQKKGAEWTETMRSEEATQKESRMFMFVFEDAFIS